jgi:hypothetical protein
MCSSVPSLGEQGFAGRIQSTLEDRLGRPVDPRLANIGGLSTASSGPTERAHGTCAVLRW